MRRCKRGRRPSRASQAQRATRANHLLPLCSPHSFETCPSPAAGMTPGKGGGQTRLLLLDGGLVFWRGCASPLLRLETWKDAFAIKTFDSFRGTRPRPDSPQLRFVPCASRDGKCVNNSFCLNYSVFCYQAEMSLTSIKVLQRGDCLQLLLSSDTADTSLDSF